MKKRQFIILILLLVIGFASVSTTLILNGKVGLGVELDDYDVIFIEALLNGEENEKAIISADKKTITFSTERLSNKGDIARLDYKVKNNSTQYDADVTINCTNDKSEYVTVTSEFDGNSIPLVTPVNMKAQEVKSGYVNAELSKAYAGEDDSIEITCKIVFTATSRDTYAYSINFDSNGGSKIDDKIVILNDAYGELETPEREGYIFLGWFDDNDEKVEEGTILKNKGNKTLYAKWEEKIYSVGIVANANGTIESTDIDITYGNTSEVKITPDANYYISNITCSDGYTVDYNLKEVIYAEQNLTIKNNSVDKSGTCTFTFSQGIFDYDYTGREQEFIVPCDGLYALEVWGAQGGDDGPGVGQVQSGGYGAYSSGQVLLHKGDLLYYNVGSKGYTYPSSTSSYNGGGLATDTSGAGGGGATHIATSSRGTLMNYKDSINELLIVAGGGGGAADYAAGGHAGGIIGVNGSGTSPGTGATQSSGYAFGVGANASGQNPAGGGGFYGGNRSNGLIYGGGGGGSSYIGNPLLTNKVMYCYKCTVSNEESTKTISTTCASSTPTANCAKQGNGYAKITLVSLS